MNTKFRKKTIYLPLGLLLVTGMGMAIGYALSRQAPTSQQTDEPLVKEIKIGKTYEMYGELSLIDDRHYVYLVDDTDYESEEELEEIQEENYPEEVYPTLYYYQGDYKREGDDIYLKPTKEISIAFETLADVKKKQYFQLKETALTDDYEDQPQLVKKEGSYQVQTGDDDGFDLAPSSTKLAKSVTELLSNYKKVEKKD